MSIDRAINNAAASVEMEGYTIDDQCKDGAVKFWKTKLQWNSTSNLY